MEMMHCPEVGCNYASFAFKYCPEHGTELVAGPLRPATNTFCPYCQAGGIFSTDKFCGTCSKKTFIFGPRIGQICLSVRAVNCLESEGIHTLWALLQKSAKDLIPIKGFGKGL